MAHPNDRPPHCRDCGSGDHPHPYENQSGGHWWLCGSCAYKREHPDAAPMPPKFRRPSAPQKESLLDAIAEVETAA